MLLLKKGYIFYKVNEQFQSCKLYLLLIHGLFLVS